MSIFYGFDLTAMLSNFYLTICLDPHRIASSVYPIFFELFKKLVWQTTMQRCDWMSKALNRLSLSIQADIKWTKVRNLFILIR